MTKLRRKIRKRIRELKEQPNWEKFNDCIQQLENSLYKKHEYFTMQRYIADALFELLKVPQWKFWIWILKMSEVKRANNLHIGCCDLDLII